MAATYTSEQIKKIAPGYRGKPEKFDITKLGQTSKSKQSTRSKPISKTLPPPAHLDKAATPTPQKNHPIWADSIFGVDVSVRELTVNEEFTPTFSRLPDIVSEVHSCLTGDDYNIGKNLTKEMLNYYASTLLWGRLLDIKRKRCYSSLSETELKLLQAISEQEWNVPQPLYLYYRSIGHVRDKTGKTVFLKDHTLPVIAAQNRSGYHSSTIDASNHNLYEEMPSLGICGDILMAIASDEPAPVPTIGPLQNDTNPTENLLGYMGPIGTRKEEIKILLNSIGITNDQFHEIVPNTRLNLQLMQKISDYLYTTRTFRNEKIKIDSLTSDGEPVQFIRTKPTADNTNENTRWTNKIIRPYSTNAEATTTFGASYFVGFQLYKEATGTNNRNWCCIVGTEARWTVPETWISNRNARRQLPDGFSTDRFVSISDSQEVRTNAITRRMIIAPR